MRELIKQDVNPFGHWAVSVEEDDVLIVHATASTPHAIPTFTQQLFLSDPDAQLCGYVFERPECGILFSPPTSTSSPNCLLLYHMYIVTKVRKIVKHQTASILTLPLAGFSTGR